MTNYLTEEGLEKLKEELDHLRKVKRKEIAEKLNQAVSFGDLTENAAYQQAKEEQAFLEGKILELEDIIKEASPVKEKHNDQIQIGSLVFLSKGWQKEKFRIVGVAEVSPFEGKISPESPLGKALFGKKKGDMVDVETPEGRFKYKILRID
jgi:transcription elongation factor GreA